MIVKCDILIPTGEGIKETKIKRFIVCLVVNLFEIKCILYYV